MRIKEISKYMTFYVTTEGCDSWNEWRTNRDGTYWENLMGMSWEEIDPPKEIIEQYREAMNVPTV